MNKAMLYLHRDDLLHPSWIIDENVVVRGDSAALQVIASAYQWIVLVPSEGVLLTQVTLPKMNKSQLKAALPFALEEGLASEIEALHFVYDSASLQYKETGKLTVAVVAHATMKMWLSLLHQWQVIPREVKPVMFALPCINNKWSLIIDDVSVLRINEANIYVCDKENLAYFLQQASRIQNAPDCLHILNPHNMNVQVLLKDNEVHYQMDCQDEEACLKLLASSECSSINLLQDPYAIKPIKSASLLQRWHIFFSLAAAWVGILFFYPAVSYCILHHQDKVLSMHIQQIYNENFPQAKQVVAPALRMQAKLRSLITAGSDNQLLILIGKIGRAMDPAIKVSQLDYDQQTLTLTLTALTAADLDHFIQALTQEGLNVKQQNTTITHDAIHATLVVQS